MLSVSQIQKRFRGAEAPILKDIHFTLNARERLGVVGPNGSGKSTLLRILAGELEADSGAILRTPHDLRSAYLAQGLSAPDETPLREVLFPHAPALYAAQQALDQQAQRLAQGAPGAQAAYDAALETLAALGYALDEAAGLQALADVGLAEMTLDDPVGILSGGQKTRLMLAALRLARPDLLLLDEPSNHLDIDALEWLEDWLQSFDGAALIVSHDRAFLDRVCTQILALDPVTATGRVFAGNYSEYLATLEREHEKHWSTWKDQELEIERMTRDLEATRKRAQAREDATVNDFSRQRAKQLMRKAMHKKTRLEKYLDSDERIDKPKSGWKVKLDFEHLPQAHGDVLVLDHACIGYDLDAPLLRDITLLLRGGERVALMGPNGSGKSTLLKTLLGQVPLLDGEARIGGSVKVGYLAQEQEILNPDLTALETLQAVGRFSHTDGRSFLHFFLFSGDDALRPVRLLSFGERARLMLALLVAQGCNLLILDEPVNHLDLPSREQFEAALSNYPGSVLLASHDRYFVEHFAQKVWHIQEGGIVVEYRDV